MPALLGNVTVISPDEAGPIKVNLFVPLSLSSKNSTNPADVEPFFTDNPALNTSFAAAYYPDISLNIRKKVEDKKIIKSISYSFKGQLVRGFSYKVKISKKKYMEMVNSKYISVLLGMSHKLISSGLNEIKKKYKKQISFQDKLICLVLNR